MKIQLSQKRIIKDAITIWNQPGPDVDIVMDLKSLTFREGSVSEIYAFHVVDHFFPEEWAAALTNWFKCLASGGRVHAINDDFEYIARAFIGGDISIDLFNDIHNHASQCTQDNVVKALRASGFKDDKISIWLDGSPEGVKKNHFEFILTAIKHAN